MHFCVDNELVWRRVVAGPRLIVRRWKLF